MKLRLLTAKPAMRTLPSESQPVTATLEYLQSWQGKPATCLAAPPDGHAQPSSTYAAMPVTISDGRGKTGIPLLDREGFQLCHAPTGMTAFAERDIIERLYYPEMAELARSASGASRAIVFDHLVRRRAPGPPTAFGAREDQRPSAASRVHCDFTPSSASRRLALEVERLGLAQVERFALINLWRSTGLPVLDAPLAVCDSRTATPDDLVAADIVYPTRTGEIFEVLYNPAHAWTYFHAMQFDEVLLFKQYDSRDGVARYTPHAAFAHPGTPAGTPPRESIEIRCLLIYN
ncbi:MAG: CmcJ/NvfI family oxidoreductase [Pseudomonadota bacterium]